MTKIPDMPDISFSAGKLASVSKFDADFFGITNEHGEYMDPLCRILLEKTYEAIVDAGNALIFSEWRPNSCFLTERMSKLDYIFVNHA